ncbi:MAG: hypothetical protein K9W46_02075 [Candidatus Heimdallarchaeum endolithica]|uniref:PKD domain-containing protein n=1 Tax=Candidatus Heimdallarchaeum endolithica TaxID=2876572 RepID=A0A9Y1BRK4_9ARCH|nr:MAG: hypothetical protein K9W46_02075 [Candidatus Heimdallarchaeum endolithica]
MIFSANNYQKLFAEIDVSNNLNTKTNTNSSSFQNKISKKYVSSSIIYTSHLAIENVSISYSVKSLSAPNIVCDNGTLITLTGIKIVFILLTTFSGGPEGVTLNTTFYFEFGDGNTKTIETGSLNWPMFVYTYNSSGVFDLYVSATYNEKTVTDTGQIIILEDTQPQFTFVPDTKTIYRYVTQGNFDQIEEIDPIEDYPTADYPRDVFFEYSGQEGNYPLDFYVEFTIRNKTTKEILEDEFGNEFQVYGGISVSSKAEFEEKVKKLSLNETYNLFGFGFNDIFSGDVEELYSLYGQMNKELNVEIEYTFEIIDWDGEEANVTGSIQLVIVYIAPQGITSQFLLLAPLTLGLITFLIKIRRKKKK